MRMMLAVTLLAASALVPAFAQGTAHGRVYTKADVERVITRLESSTDKFRKAVDKQLDKSVLDDTKPEDRINDQVADLEKATDRLRDRFDRSDRWLDTRDQVQDVVREARDINGLFNRLSLYSKVKPVWLAVKTDVNTLAGIYNLPRVQ